MSQEQPIEVIDLTETDEENAIIEIIDDNDEDMEQDIEVIEDDVIEIEDDDNLATFNLTEHLGQHISESRTCEKCAKISPIDDETEEHLGVHRSCQKCDSLNN